ncbi:MAG: amidinotransferase [Planctomycetes bacterium]|nr:amidinotransferase [Planctomycetota bacterium]
MSVRFGIDDMIQPLRRAAVKRPREAWLGQSEIAARHADLGFSAEPDFERAVAEHRALVELLRSCDVEVLAALEDNRTSLDSIYVHDAAHLSERGAFILAPTKPSRCQEGLALRDALRDWEIPVFSELSRGARAEGGDLVRLDADTLLVGRSHRTNELGVLRLRQAFEPLGVEVIEVPLPHWQGHRTCLHLQSMLSMIDHDLALVWKRPCPITLLELLRERGIGLVAAVESEVPAQAANVLALSPRRVVAVAGANRTRDRLERAGCEVLTFPGTEIALKGGGGPTCLVLPLWRQA